MTTIYVLLCEKNKWYVGKTNKKPVERFKEHLAGKGSAWTRKYKPITIAEIYEGDNFDENKKTKELMSKHGINNVRGGSYCQIKLDKASVGVIQKEIDGAEDKCIKCGGAGHFARYCKAKKKVNKKAKKKVKCERCNRDGHTEEQCYATTYIVETDDEDSAEEEYEEYKKKSKGRCYRCGRQGHYSNDCYASSHAKGYYLED